MENIFDRSYKQWANHENDRKNKSTNKKNYLKDEKTTKK